MMDNDRSGSSDLEQVDNRHVREDDNFNHVCSENNTTPSLTNGRSTEEDLVADGDISIEGIFSNDPDTVLRCTMELRKLPASKLAKFDIVIRLVELVLQVERPARLQFELATLLTEIIGAIEQAKMNRIVDRIVEIGACTVFTKFLELDNDQITATAARLLAKIASNKKLHSGMLIEQGMIPLLIGLVDRVASQGHVNSLVKRTVLNTVANCVADFFWISCPPPEPNVIDACLRLIKQLLQNESDAIVTSACSSLMNIAWRSDAFVEQLVKTDILDRVVEIVNISDDCDLLGAALTAFRPIIAREPQAVVDRNALPAFKRLLLLNNLKTQRYIVSRVLMNIAPGNEIWIQAVLTEDLLPPVIELFQGEDANIHRAAALTIQEFVSCASNDQIALLHQIGAFAQLADILTVRHCTEPIIDLLTALHSIVKATKTANRVKEMWDNFSDRLEFIDQLHRILNHHQDRDVRRMTARIIDEFWTAEQRFSARGRIIEYLARHPVDEDVSFIHTVNRTLKEFTTSHYKHILPFVAGLLATSIPLYFARKVE